MVPAVGSKTKAAGVSWIMAEKSDEKGRNEPSPKDAQKGGQGAVGTSDKGAELNQRGHPGADSRKN
jgi:hypothetical protein